MTVNQAYESDKSVDTAGRDKRALSNVSANGTDIHKIQLDTYFADERIHVPEKVSAVHCYH